MAIQVQLVLSVTFPGPFAIERCHDAPNRSSGNFFEDLCERLQKFLVFVQACDAKLGGQNARCVCHSDLDALTRRCERIIQQATSPLPNEVDSLLHNIMNLTPDRLMKNCVW